MKHFLLSLLLISMVGCSSLKSTPPPQMVQVAIQTKCEPITIVRDVDYAFTDAKKEMSLYDKFKLALYELESVTNQNIELKAALKECTK